MRQQVKPFHGKIIPYSLILSLLLHLVLLLFKLAIAPPEDKQTAKKEEKRIRLIVRKKPKKKQIVTTQKKKEKRPPQEADFLGETDQNFDRQTIAKNVAPFKEAGKGSQGEQPELSQNPSPEQKQKASKKPKIAGKKLRFQDLSINHTQMNEIQTTSQASRKGTDNGNPETVGLAQNNDYVEDVPMGDVTNLNTMEYKYYGFFNRIKKKLEQHWGKSLRQKARTMYQSGRRIPANSLRITSLVISMDSKGNIINIAIKGSSGVQEFDEAALESFNKAGPFPNPPRSMIKNGAANIEWGFIVKG